jgi:hypothetical protein
MFTIWDWNTVEDNALLMALSNLWHDSPRKENVVRFYGMLKIPTI